MTISNDGDKIFVSWESQEHEFVEIWLTTTVADFPDSLKKKGCEFQRSSNEPVYRLVCPTDGGAS